MVAGVGGMVGRGQVRGISSTPAGTDIHNVSTDEGDNSMFPTLPGMPRKQPVPQVSWDDFEQKTNEEKMRRAGAIPFVLMVLWGLKMFIDPFDEGLKYVRWREPNQRRIAQNEEMWPRQQSRTKRFHPDEVEIPSREDTPYRTHTFTRRIEDQERKRDEEMKKSASK
jgi:hypothetical protein